MPLAMSLPLVLADAPLETVVSAIADIADTLAQIFEQHGVAHRDIKSGNLYFFMERYTVGDFGLLWHEEIAGMTAAGKVTGPLSFTARSCSGRSTKATSSTMGQRMCFRWQKPFGR